jgi:hypothetical protein
MLTNTPHTPMVDIQIREILRAEYDALPAEQKQFFDKLIAEGRARVVDPAAAAPTAKDLNQSPKRGAKPQDILRRLVGAPVRLALLDGEVVTGNLDFVAPYEVIVDDVVYFKHALVSIARVDPVDPGQA